MDRAIRSIISGLLYVRGIHFADKWPEVVAGLIELGFCLVDLSVGEGEDDAPKGRGSRIVVLHCGQRRLEYK